MLEGGWSVEQAGLDAVEGGVVVVDDGVPELSGVFLGHLHDLVGVAVADEIGLRILA